MEDTISAHNDFLLGRDKKKNKELSSFLEQFFSLEVVPGKKVRIPYWRNRLFPRRIQGPFGGKGTPQEIKKATLQKAREAGVNLREMSEEEIRKFMKQKRIGLDCSGFAFQILAFLFPGFWQGLKMAPGRSKNPIRRFNAQALTSEENTSPVKKVKDIKMGDLIPLSFLGKKTDHVLVVVGKTDKEIIYAHSSQKTPITGPHLGKIIVTDSNAGLEKQKWLEKTRKGAPLITLLQGVPRRIAREKI